MPTSINYSKLWLMRLSCPGEGGSTAPPLFSFSPGLLFSPLFFPLTTNPTTNLHAKKPSIDPAALVNGSIEARRPAVAPKLAAIALLQICATIADVIEPG